MISLYEKFGKRSEDMVPLKEENLKDQIYAFLDDLGGYADYDQKVEDVMDEFGLDRDDAEGYIWSYASGVEGTGLRDEYLYDDDEEIDESVVRKRFVNEKLDNGYLSSQSQKDLERINNWYNFLQHHLEQINKWCTGGPMATSPEYSGMLYNLPRCIKACQYMQEYFESILEDMQIEE